nr:Proline--tRNA ligase [Ipomoea batatas]GME04528.1 Proline--tRNA ligase [Ipomoea batatas]GME13449.1 Proline--tRNA ligase [Ipomoea batatas]
MEKSKSFPYHSSSSANLDLEGGRTKSYSFNGRRPAGECNPEVKRRKRVAAYNMYAMEGKPPARGFFFFSDP